MTDSQLITALVGVQLDEGKSLFEALKDIVETKILGTYRISAIELNDPKHVYFVKNSGEFIIGINKE